MKQFNQTSLLRFSVAIILLAHSIPGMFDNGINNFGKLYLNEIGFAPFGVLLAWLVKLSHLVSAFCLIFEKFVKWACAITICILIAGIILVHFQEGWYVVGAGRNGIEFNFLLVFVLLTIMFPDGLSKTKIKE